MNRLKATRLFVAALFLVQGTHSSAITRQIATQNVNAVQSENSREMARREALRASMLNSQDAKVIPQETANSGDWIDSLPGDGSAYYARVYAHLKKVGVELDVLSSTQSAYLNIPVEGPYKPEYYRY